ncbi:MAG: universal stress protein [Candidatus Hydrogenedens sp.]|nr:universal stress protein [Candidatus Hydrogenedens sp.]
MKYLAAIDYSPISTAVLDQAARFALAEGATVYLLHVEPPDPDFVGYEAGPPHVRQAVAREAMEHHAELRTMKESLEARGVNAHALVIQGPFAEKILDEARRLDAGLILMGSRGHGALHHLVIGSVSEEVVQHAPCPVLLVPHHPAGN